jgi:cytidine deaminase
VSLAGPAVNVAGVEPAVAAAVEADIRQLVERAPDDPLDASVVPAPAARELVARHGLRSVEELAFLALPIAREMARPPISGYRVAAAGIEADGSVVLGANLEFPGTDLATTIHAEGFVPLRVRRRGRALATLALGSARPCAHCRQTLAESTGAEELVLIDLEGHRRSLDDLYPLAFRPGALGVDADRPGRVGWPSLVLEAGEVTPPTDIADTLLAAAARAHAPYSAAPSAVALRLRDGRILSAGCVESVAFNPTISAGQAAMVELAAGRADGPDIEEAWLAKAVGGLVDPEAGFRALLGAMAPAARLHIAPMRVAT